MSQPEMQPEGPHRKESGAGSGAGTGTDRSGSRHGSGPRDLTGRPFPLGDWGEPAERLDELYRWVEAGALQTTDWYLHDRIRKRRVARLLRLGTAAGVVAGAALPLLDLTGELHGSAAGAICRCCWARPAWPATGTSVSPRAG